jgi:hypothetical protein
MPGILREEPFQARDVVLESTSSRPRVHARGLDRLPDCGLYDFRSHHVPSPSFAFAPVAESRCRRVNSCRKYSATLCGLVAVAC